MPYDPERMREMLKKSLNPGRRTDPTEFQAPQVREGTIKYKVFILPSLNEGEPCASGVATQTSDSPFHIVDAVHWVDRKPYPCPRSSPGNRCPMCDAGFTLLRELKDSGIKDEDKSKAIKKQWLPSTKYLVNLYFPPIAPNPEELHGKVLWYGAPQTLMNIWRDTLMREDAGDDPDEPEAYGVFFDEFSSYMFNLNLTPGSRPGWNEYKTSRFGGKVKVPLVMTKDKKADREAIQRVMNLRHDLFTKRQDYDMEQITSLVNRLLHGDDSGFDVDEVKSAAPKQQRHHQVAESALNHEVEAQPMPTRKAAPVRMNPSVDSDDDAIDDMLNSLDD